MSDSDAVLSFDRKPQTVANAKTAEKRRLIKAEKPVASAIGSRMRSKMWTLIYWLNVQGPFLPSKKTLDWQGFVVWLHGSEKPNEWPSTELERLRGIDPLPARMRNGIRKYTAFHSVPSQFIAPELKTSRQTPR